MRKESKAEKKFKEEQEEFRRVYQAEPLLLMVAVIRNTLSEEAKVLEVLLSELGLSAAERDTIYRELSLRRSALEAELYKPLAYEKVRAQAKTLGLLNSSVDTQPENRGA